MAERYHFWLGIEMLRLNGSPIACVSKGEHFRISPSPYFDVVIDGRAFDVAAPMAGRAAVMGVNGGRLSRAPLIPTAAPLPQGFDWLVKDKSKPSLRLVKPDDDRKPH